MHAKYYLVIAGSTRPTRRSPTIAKWVANLGETICNTAFEVIDLRDLGLGLDDEPGIPVKDDYLQETTRRWSERVRTAKGVLFVTPQYNWGYPAPLKNAIDHLYYEWCDKPALIVSYGGHGGGKCAAQLREVLAGMGLNLTQAMPGLRLTPERIEANDGDVDPDQDFAGQRDEVMDALRELVGLSSDQKALA